MLCDPDVCKNKCFVYVFLRLDSDCVCGQIMDSKGMHIKSFSGISLMIEQIKSMREAGMFSERIISIQECVPKTRQKHTTLFILELRYFQNQNYQGILHGCRERKLFKSMEECGTLLYLELKRRCKKYRRSGI